MSNPLKPIPHQATIRPDHPESGGSANNFNSRPCSAWAEAVSERLRPGRLISAERQRMETQSSIRSDAERITCVLGCSSRPPMD